MVEKVGKAVKHHCFQPLNEGFLQKLPHSLYQTALTASAEPLVASVNDHDLPIKTRDDKEEMDQKHFLIFAVLTLSSQSQQKWISNKAITTDRKYIKLAQDKELGFCRSHLFL